MDIHFFKKKCFLKEYQVKILKLFIILIFPISIFVDLINGYTQLKLGFHTPIGQIFRIIIIIILVYLVSKKPKVKFLKFLFVWIFLYFIGFSTWIITTGIENQKFTFSSEINDALRIIYLFLLIIFFKQYYYELKDYKVHNIITNYGIIISFFIIMSFFSGWGHNSYGEEYGFGTKSWFKAGNDIGITLLFCLINSIFLFLIYRHPNDLLKSFFISFGCILIGSRVALFGFIIISVITLYIYIFKFKPHNIIKYKLTLIFIIPCILILIILLGYYLYSIFDDYTLKRLTYEEVSSARTTLIEPAVKHIQKFNLLQNIFGQGASSLYANTAELLYGDLNDERVIEADGYEIIGSYGFILGLLTLLPFYYWTFISILKYIKDKTILNIELMVICILFISIGFLSGHCLKNVMLAPIYAYFISNIKNYDFNNK